MYENISALNLIYITVNNNTKSNIKANHFYKIEYIIYQHLKRINYLGATTRVNNTNKLNSFL